MIDIFLILVIMAILLERYFYTRQHHKEKQQLLDELSRSNKALVSKNANDYVMMSGIDKVAPEPRKPYVEPDAIPEDQMSDDEFFEAIGKKLKDDESKNP